VPAVTFKTMATRAIWLRDSVSNSIDEAWPTVSPVTTHDHSSAVEPKTLSHELRAMLPGAQPASSIIAAPTRNERIGQAYGSPGR
jgi:hypothetical protein